VSSNSVGRAGAIAATVMVAYFVAAAAILHILRPDINPLSSGLSYYGKGPYSVLMNTAFDAIGVAAIVVAIGLSQFISQRGRSWPGLALLGIWGITQPVAAVFPIDLPGASHTTSGAIHGVVGFSFVLIGPATFLIARRLGYDARWTRYSARAKILAGAIVTMSVLLFVFNGMLTPLGLGGLVQRLYWLTIVVWLMFIAVRLRNAPRAAVA
jgi:hypothetical protein